MKTRTLFKHLRKNGMQQVKDADWGSIWETEDEVIRVRVMNDFGTVKRIDDLNSNSGIAYPEACEARNFIDFLFMRHEKRV